MMTKQTTVKEGRRHNSRFAKAGVWCFYDSEVLNSSFVHLMKFSAENPRLRKAAKRYGQVYETTTERTTADKRANSILFRHLVTGYLCYSLTNRMETRNHLLKRSGTEKLDE
jgi:hypothetical protein